MWALWVLPKECHLKLKSVFSYAVRLNWHPLSFVCQNILDHYRTAMKGLFLIFILQMPRWNPLGMMHLICEIIGNKSWNIFQSAFHFSGQCSAEGIECPIQFLGKKQQSISMWKCCSETDYSVNESCQPSEEQLLFNSKFKSLDNAHNSYKQCTSVNLTWSATRAFYPNLQLHVTVNNIL